MMLSGKILKKKSPAMGETKCVTEIIFCFGCSPDDLFIPKVIGFLIEE